MTDRVQMLRARNADDRELILEVPGMYDAGTVVVDDFHVIEDDVKHRFADFMKDLADREDMNTKIILIGINKAGDSLIKFAPDLNNRIDTIHFEINDEDQILELVRKGEDALNIEIECAEMIASDARGSFHIAQMLCHEICLLDGVIEKAERLKEVTTSMELVKDRVIDELSRIFLPRAIKFARGKRFRREGRAPYLHLLHWLATSDEWTLSIDQALAMHPEIRGSVGQIVDKGYLEDFVQEEEEIKDLFHYDAYTRVLAVEDPKFMYF